MKLIELHILHNLPVSCVNRDDLGSPKSAVFGGVNRARVSSQCWKRAIRFKAKELLPEFYQGERTKLAFQKLAQALRERGLGDGEAEQLSQRTLNRLVQKEKDKSASDAGNAGPQSDKKRDGKSSSLLFVSPSTLDKVADALASGDEKTAKNAYKKLGDCSDAADIALFGRFAAAESSLTVEAAGMFNHPISTQKIETNDLDFFTAVDDIKPRDEDAGAAHMGTNEFNSACYYRYVGVNLEQLKDNLAGLGQEERRQILAAFVRAAVLAVPGARDKTMNADVRPSFVLGLAREGQPLQLANAFEKPVAFSRGKSVVENSREALETEFDHMKEVWGESAETECRIPETGFNPFIDQLSAHAL